MQLAGRTEDYVYKLPSHYKRNSTSIDPEFLQYLFAVIYVESRFDRKAMSHMDAYGLMQVTEVATRDAADHCQMKKLRDMNKMFDSGTNVKYGSCFLRKLYEGAEGDWTKVLITYNGGYRALTQYEKGETINAETANYVLKVNRALKICRTN